VVNNFCSTLSSTQGMTQRTGLPPGNDLKHAGNVRSSGRVPYSPNPSLISKTASSVLERKGRGFQISRLFGRTSKT
jgi:hypothetical protein